MLKKRLADINALIAEVKRTAEITQKRGEKFSLRNLIVCIKNAPTVDAVEVVHGRWIEKYHDNPLGGYYLGHCSVCDEPDGRKKNYCPNCGAKMDGGNEDG